MENKLKFTVEIEHLENMKLVAHVFCYKNKRKSRDLFVQNEKAGFTRASITLGTEKELGVLSNLLKSLSKEIERSFEELKE